MSEAPARTLNYERARGLLLLVGLIILGLVALIMYVRRVDPTEVVAALFFLPIFVGFLYWGIRGGLVIGALAAIGYIVLRMPAIDAVGAGRFAGLIASRTVGYLVFGGVGGWAVEQLNANLNKLDLYDHVDDETGLNNSRSLVETIQRERSRAQRYHEVFSVVIVEGSLDGLQRRPRATLMRDVGQAIRTGVRTVDYAFHTSEHGRDLFAAVLPETGVAGVATFATKLSGVVTGLLDHHGLDHDQFSVLSATYPDDEAAIEGILERARAIVMVDFPETAQAK